MAVSQRKIFAIFVEITLNKMNNRIVKAISAFVFAVVSALLVFLIIKYVDNGLETARQKGFLAIYIILLIYSILRTVTLLRDVFRK